MNTGRAWWKQYWIVAVVSLAAVLMAACGAEEATPTPTTVPATPTPTPGAAAATPTPVAAEATPTPAIVGEQPQYGGILNLWARREPSTYDPMGYGQSDFQSRYASVMGLLVLMDRETDSIPSPHLAESWDVSEDGKIWTFNLRQDVKWHDGVPFTSADVVYYFNRVFDPPAHAASNWASRLPSFQRVSAPDDYTVVFEFGATEVEVLAFFGFPAAGTFLAKHQIEPLDKEKKVAPPELIGTGPFKVKAFRRESLLEMERNPDYWGKDEQGNQLPYLDGIRIASGRDQATMFAAYRTGRIHKTAIGGGMELTADQVDSVNTKMGGGAWVHMKTVGAYAGMNPNNSKEPWTDVRVRKAADLAIDREFVCEAGKQGLCMLAFRFIPGSYGALPQDEVMAAPGWRQPKDQDLAEAKRLMAEAGFPNGFTTKTIVRDNARWFAEPVAFELSKIGIEVQLQMVDTITYEDLRLKGDFHSGMESTTGSHVPGVISQMNPYIQSDSPYNRTKTQDAKMDDYIVRIGSIVDPAEREAEIHEMLRYMLEMSFDFSVGFPVRPIGVSGKLKGWIGPVHQDFNNDFRDVWLEQ